jgi:hypothetical protein
MVDANLHEFYGRIAKIQKARALGYGFEADGTLGRSHYRRPVQRRRSFVAPILIVLMCGFGMKGTIHSKVGNDVYQTRVNSLLEGQGFERLGGYLMKSDPVTLFVSQQIKRYAPMI